METFPHLASLLIMFTLMCACTNNRGTEINESMSSISSEEIKEEDIQDRVSSFDHFSELEKFKAGFEINNGSFETGDLTGWYKDNDTPAFTVINDDVDIWNNPVAKTGNYFLGFGINNYSATTESYSGSIRSSLFKVGGSGQISFSLAGNCTDNLVGQIMLYNENGDDIEITKFNNTRFSQGGLSGFILVPYVFNLKEYKDKYCYFVLNDFATTNFGFMSIDNVRTYYPENEKSINHFGSLASFLLPKSKQEAINGAKLVDIEFNNTLKTEYNYNEEFSSDTLLVYGIYDNNVLAPLGKSEIAVNKTSYKKNVPGEYEIQVMAVGTTVGKSFKVKVNPEGIYIRGSKQLNDNDELLVFGDSQMAMWNNLKSDIGLFNNVNNVAVGGSTTDDWMGKIDLLCTKNAPFVLMNLGGNDIRNRAKKPEYIANNIEIIIKKFKEKSPNSHIYMYEVSCGPATVYNYWDAAQKTIDLYKQLELKYDNFTVLSIKGQMMGEDGLPDTNKFREDHLHVSPDAYVYYARALKEYIITK